MAAELRRLGFAVKPQLDLNRKSLYAAIRQFANQAQSAQLAVVYYSGHGMQSAGENYLIPTDARINDEKDIHSDGVPLRDLLDDLDEANVQKTVVILDACRDNPYQTRTRGGPRGLARVPELFKMIFCAKGVHGLPKTFVFKGLEFTFSC